MASNSSERARTFAVALIIALTIFASIAIYESSSLQWPLTGGIHTSHTKPSPLSISSILVRVDTIGCFLSTCVIQPLGMTPVADASILVETVSNHPLRVYSGLTNTTGESFVTLSPGQYEVIVQNISFFDEKTAYVTADPGNTTELNVLFNETSYTASFFEIANPVSSGNSTELPPWGSMFLYLEPSAAIKLGSNLSTYLSLEYLNGQPPGTFFAAHIVGELNSTAYATVWLQVQPEKELNVTSVSAINILTVSTTSTTIEYPMYGESINDSQS